MYKTNEYIMIAVYINAHMQFDGLRISTHRGQMVYVHSITCPPPPNCHTAELRGILKQPTWFLIETSSFSYPGPTLCSCSWYGTISLAPVLPGPPHDQLDLSHVCGRELNRMMATVL